MSNDATYKYLEDRITDGLLSAADAAIGMGMGNRKDSDVALHSRFLVGIGTAEGAARCIAHARGENAQGIAWVRLAGRLGKMRDASTRSVMQTIKDTAISEYAPKVGRGVLWVRLGELLRALAEDCAKATQQRSASPLIVGGREYMN